MQTQSDLSRKAYETKHGTPIDLSRERLLPSQEAADFCGFHVKHFQQIMRTEQNAPRPYRLGKQRLAVEDRLDRFQFPRGLRNPTEADAVAHLAVVSPSKGNRQPLAGGDHFAQRIRHQVVKDRVNRPVEHDLRAEPIGRGRQFPGQWIRRQGAFIEELLLCCSAQTLARISAPARWQWGGIHDWMLLRTQR